MHFSRSTILLGLLLVCVSYSCQSKEPAHTEEPEADHSVASSEIAASWTSEIIELPPDFAPNLPKGVEELRFAPGMFDAQAEDYWSYVFVLRLEEEVGGLSEVQSLLDHYYVGLITTVARSRDLTLNQPAATVEVSTFGDQQYRAKVDLVDAFVTGQPITIHMNIELKDHGNGSHFLAAVSPQPRHHDIWKALDEVLQAIE